MFGILYILSIIALCIATEYDDFRSNKYGILVLKAIILIFIISLFV